MKYIAIIYGNKEMWQSFPPEVGSEGESAKWTPSTGATPSPASCWAPTGWPMS